MTDWSLVNPANVGRGVMDAFERGAAMGQAAREMQDRKEMRNALAALATDPENQPALAAVFQRDPRLGASLMDRAEEKAFNRDLGAYVQGGSVNALAGIGAAPARPSVNALVPDVAPGASFGEAFKPVEGGSYPVPGNAPDGVKQQADLSVLGKPQTDSDHAFLRMVQRDPIKALKIQSTVRDNFVDRLKSEHDFYSAAVEELSRATDQGTWEQSIRRLAPMSQALGTDLLSVVPIAYPGPQGVQQLMQRAMPIKDQLSHIMQQANIDADNARADRNTESLIDAREGRLGEQQRHNRVNEGNARRGQDIASTDRKRGQDKRGREKIVTVATPDEARKLPSGTKFRGPDGIVRLVP